VNEDETMCADCYTPEPRNGWAEEAPHFRLCYECANARGEDDDEVTA